MSRALAWGEVDAIGSPHPVKPARRIAGATIVAVMVLLAFSLWTVIPLAWIWIGSKLSPTQSPAAGPYAVTFFGIVVSIIIVVWALALLNRVYARLTGTSELSMGPVRLIRSLSDERKPRRRVSVMEAVIVASVLAALIAMAVWFFWIAGSPVPNS